MNQRCPICDRTNSRRFFQKYGYWILTCEVCSHQFTEFTPSAAHVARVYNDRYFQGGGAGYPNYLSEAQILRSHSQRYSKILANYMQPGTVLDVGAAAGFVLQGFLDSGWSGRGIEPNSHMAEYARIRLGLTVDTGTLEQIQSRERYDLISMIQVVAHFFELNKALQAAAAATNPNGFWLIETWNRESCAARTFGTNWHEYSPPSVLHWFSPTGLQRLAARYGFREVASGRPAKWINGAHAKSLLRYKLESSRLGKIAVRMLDVIPERLSIPYPAEDLFWALFQKSY